MTQSTRSFTQSLRLLDPVNQKRIQIRQKILWPDYETLNLLNTFYENSQNTETQMDLSNLFMYCPYEENFTVIKTNKQEYLGLNQLYSDQYTHLAFWICKQDQYTQRNKLATRFTENSQQINNRRQKSLQKVYKTKQKIPKTQQIYVILCKRPIAIDQIIKTPHKVCIAVVPLSGQKFLWGGALNYEEFQSLQHEKKEQSSLFKTGGQSFGFKIEARPSFVPSSYRKSNGLIDKRQQRYSNYFKAQKEEPKQIQTQKARRQCSNKIKILPQHIRQHQQLLYIQIDLTNHSQLPQRADQYQFVSIDIYGRHLKPTYGGVYENQSQSQDQDDYFDELKGALNKYRKLLKQEIFLVYSMPFMQFNSYLQSQINYDQNQQLREVNFRGSCLMFSAMKKLQLKSTSKKQHKQKGKQKQQEQNPFQKNKKHKFIETKEGKRFFTKDQDLIEIDTNNCHSQQKQKHFQGLNKANIKDKEIIKILPSTLNLEKQQLQLSRRQKIRDYKRQIINKLCKGLTQTQKIFNSQQQQLIYLPVFNPQGFEPLRIGVERKWMAFLNIQISRSITRVFVQNERIKGYEQNEIHQQLTTGDMNRKRLSVYVGKKKGDKPTQKERDLVGIDVFLTDKVYKQQTVYGLISLFKQLETLKRSNNLNEENCYEQMFTNIISIEQFRNFVILIGDIRGQKQLQVENNTNDDGHQINNTNDYDQQIKQLLWVQIIQRMNNYTEGQLERIRQVQSQTNSLLQQAQRVSLNIQLSSQRDRCLEQKQQSIIHKIKQYHYYYSTDSQQTALYVNLFVSFFTSQLNNESNQRMVYHLLSSKQTCQFVQQVFNGFLLMNCKLMIQSYSVHLSTLIQKLQQQSIIGNNQHHLSSSNVNDDKNINLLLCQVLKKSINYVIDNLSSIPINIFLSQPLQQIQSFDRQQDHLDSLDHNNHRCNNIFNYKKLTRFLKRYFIRGHNFLDREANQSLIDADNVHMNITTDLLNLYIKVANIQIGMRQSIQNDDGFRCNQDRQIKNVVKLIEWEYSHCLISNNDLQFDKLLFVLNNNDDNSRQQLIRSQVHSKFKRNYVQSKQMQRLIERKQRQILQHQNEWIQNNLSYLINWNQHLIRQQKQSQPTIIINNEYNQPIRLCQSNQYHSSIFNFHLNIEQSNNHLQSFISFYPALFNNNNHNNSSSILNDSYSINVVKTHLGLNYQSNSYNNNGELIAYSNKSLLDCYQVFVTVQITTNKSLTNKTENKQQQSINDPNKIILKGSNIFIFQNFNHNQINKNNIQLHPYLYSQNRQKHSIKQYSQLSNIHQVNIKIYSTKLPILSASLSFINLRLPKYLKNLFKKYTSFNSRKSTLHATNRKTIGGRYTQHLNNRKSFLSIEQNIFFSQSSTKSKNNPQFSTLFNLPQTLIFDLLRVDKSYIQDQEKILHFIDEFYQRNQPQYEDYILYLCLRPNFIRLSTILRHYFANKIKYDDSKILNSIIKNKLSSLTVNKQNQNISQLIIKKPRISSYKPLKNIFDTNQERQLLNKYMKDLTRKNSLSKNQHSQSIGKNSLFAKKSIFQVNQQRKENLKEFQI